MKKIYPVVIAFLCFLTITTNAQERGELIKDSLILELSKDAILEVYNFYGLPEILFPVSYDVEIHRVEYWTLDGKGENLIPASGLVTIPVQEGCDFPLLNYNHGTLEYDSTLSDLNAKIQQHFVGVPFGAIGYVTALPDYLGYGATPKNHPHPYIHAKSEATAVVDMLRASKVFCGNNSVLLNEQLFLLGYSQGGHVGLATHRELEMNHADEFSITASSMGAGAYDISGMMRDSMLYSEEYSNTFFLAFVVAGYEFIYGNIYEELNDVFIAPYDSLIAEMLDRTDPQAAIRSLLPSTAVEMFQPDYLEAFKTDSLHPLNVALRENDVYNWIPQAPLKFTYCEGDKTVPYQNSIFTINHMNDLGASDVTGQSVGASLDHGTCTYPAVLSAKFWFDGFANFCTVPVAEVLSPEQLEIYPNPFESSISINFKDHDNTTFQTLTIYDWMGRKVFSKNINGQEQIDISAYQMQAGSYLFELKGKDGSLWKKMIKV